jgi:hypothetical protein
MESLARTIVDLHKSSFHLGLPKISGCLYSHWKMLYEQTKGLTAAGGISQAC